MSTIKIGKDCKFYRGPAGALATTEIQNVKDITLNLDVSEEDATTREGGGWETPEPILFRASVDFEMLWKTADANFTAIQGAFFAKTVLAFAILDEAGGQGLNADFKVFKFTRTEPIAGIVKAAVTIKPCYETRAPAWKP